MADGARVEIAGTKLGRHTDEQGTMHGEIVQVADEGRPEGPAENAFVYIEATDAGPRARYLSWINLYDIENAGRRQPGRWHLVEPQHRCEIHAAWLPFGWGAPPFPSVADVID